VLPVAVGVGPRAAAAAAADVTSSSAWPALPPPPHTESAGNDRNREVLAKLQQGYVRAVYRMMAIHNQPEAKGQHHTSLSSAQDAEGPCIKELGVSACLLAPLLGWSAAALTGTTYDEPDRLCAAAHYAAPASIFAIYTHQQVPGMCRTTAAGTIAAEQAVCGLT
jgi:hypothetical protein